MKGTIFIGIDVAKDKFDIAVRNKEAIALEKFANNKEGCQACLEWLQKQQISPAPLIVESTGSLHWLICLFFVDAGYDVRLINPLITKKYQKSSIRDAKNDRIDAIRLTDIARIEDDLPVFFDSRETLKVKRYESLLAILERTKQQLQRSYRDAVEALNMIDVSLDLSCMQDCLNVLEETIDTLKTMITETATPFAKQLAQTPGVSLFQATVLTNAIKGRTFATRDKLIAFFGLDVRVRQSGNWHGKGSLSKRGNPFHRKILFQLGWSLWRHNPIYQQYYESMKSRDKHYFTCILAIARKFLRSLFSQYQQLALDNSL